MKSNIDCRSNNKDDKDTPKDAFDSTTVSNHGDQSYIIGRDIVKVLELMRLVGGKLILSRISRTSLIKGDPDRLVAFLDGVGFGLFFVLVATKLLDMIFKLIIIDQSYTSLAWW